MKVAVIPARWSSTRFPGKPLALIAGLPMVQQVRARCLEAECFHRVVVATDDERIARVVEGFGGEVVMTDGVLPTGTDRVAAVARALPPDAILVNVQGDEPALSPNALRTLVAGFASPEVDYATLVRPLLPSEVDNPNVVKVVRDARGRALYFSRCPIPYSWEAPVPRWAHLGIYGYRSATLARVAATPPTPLERAERLEQLRVLELGISIHCFETVHLSRGVDLPEDVVQAEAAIAALAR